MKLDPAVVVEARERLGLTIEMAAERAEVSKNSISRAEHGLDIRPITARRIAHGLGLEVRDLYPKAAAPTSSPKETDEERRANTVCMLYDAVVSQQPENEVFKQLVQLPKDQLAYLSIDIMKSAVQLQLELEQVHEVAHEYDSLTWTKPME